MSKNIGVVVTGVSGRMGQMIVSGILNNAQIELVGALEREGHNWIGQDVGLASGGTVSYTHLTLPTRDDV